MLKSNFIFYNPIKFYFLFYFLFSFLFQTSWGQTSFFKLRYEAKSITDTFPINIYPIINYPVMQLSSLPLKVYIKNITRSGKENIMTGYLYNEEFKTVLIGNGFSGSEVFIGTNDTIEINIKSFPKGQKFLIDSIHNYMFLNFRFLNRNKIVHQFFDSLAYIAGIVNVDNVTFKDAYYNIDTFFKIATLQYLKRLNYLTNYNKNHQLGEPYTHYAFMEIKSAYLFNLLTVFMNPVKYVKKGQLSQQYIDSILSFKLDDEDAFYNTFWYKPAVFTYVSTVLNEMDYRNYYSDIQLKNRFETIRKNFAGKMRDYLLTSLLSEFYKKQNKNYDSLIIVYHSLCSNKIYINSIDSLIDVESKRRVLSENEALNNRVNNFYGKSFLFKNIINSKPLVIDCWASWCIPCIEQMAITKKFEVKYSGKIDFIFLSFDKEKIKWISKVKQLNLYKNNCYLLKGNFRSVFAQYFDIGSIPRYIIIDKEGKVVTANSIRPSHKVEFDELLKDLID